MYFVLVAYIGENRKSAGTPPSPGKNFSTQGNADHRFGIPSALKPRCNGLG